MKPSIPKMHLLSYGLYYFIHIKLTQNSCNNVHDFFKRSVIATHRAILLCSEYYQCTRCSSTSRRDVIWKIIVIHFICIAPDSTFLDQTSNKYRFILQWSKIILQSSCKMMHFMILGNNNNNLLPHPITLPFHSPALFFVSQNSASRSNMASSCLSRTHPSPPSGGIVRSKHVKHKGFFKEKCTYTHKLKDGVRWREGKVEEGKKHIATIHSVSTEDKSYILGPQNSTGNLISKSSRKRIPVDIF